MCNELFSKSNSFPLCLAPSLLLCSGLGCMEVAQMACGEFYPAHSIKEMLYHYGHKNRCRRLSSVSGSSAFSSVFPSLPASRIPPSHPLPACLPAFLPPSLATTPPLPCHLSPPPSPHGLIFRSWSLVPMFRTLAPRRLHATSPPSAAPFRPLVTWSFLLMGRSTVGPLQRMRSPVILWRC